MSGAIPSLPNTPSWRGAQLKAQDSFTFTLRETFSFMMYNLSNSGRDHDGTKLVRMLTTTTLGWHSKGSGFVSELCY